MTLTSVQAPLQISGVGVQFRRAWALRDCSFDLREGRITALVGPNGAGKSTLMTVAAGLRRATEGHVEVYGERVSTRGIHPALGYLAQDKPLYPRFTVADMVALGTHLNPGWDQTLVDRLVNDAALPVAARVRTLSGGQRTRLALALALGRRPSVLMLDEPLAELDPLARFEVQQTLLTQVADTGLTVLMSSHIVSEIQDSCDDLVILRAGRVALDQPVEDVLATHHVLIGPGDTDQRLPWLSAANILEVRIQPRQTMVLVDQALPPLPPGWSSAPATLEEVVMAHLRARHQTTALNGAGQ